MRSEKDSRPGFCLATASKTLKRKIGTQGKSNFISLNILGKHKNSNFIADWGIENINFYRLIMWAIADKWLTSKSGNC